MKSFLVAVQFLTVLPLGRREEVSHDELKKSIRFFPLVGLLQGGILWTAAHSIYSLFPFEAATGLVLLIWIVMSGALHLDGFADTVDGLYGGNDKEEILRIMKKGDIGSMGVVALVLIILIKFLAIFSLPSEMRFKLLFLTPLIGKGSILILNFHSPYARKDGGLGKAFVEGMESFVIYVTILITLTLTFFLVGLKGLLLLIVITCLILIGKQYTLRKMGGVTGDTMGAAAETGELFFLLGALL
jgi:adenosylcobinamide-GDP ribazoletransferase